MLTSKFSCFLVVSLACLLGTLLVMPSQGQSWAAFKRKHIDSNNKYPSGNYNLYCENKMQRRNMTKPLCKPRNTFIFARESTVKLLCRRIKGPVPFRSPASFKLVDCNYTGGFPPKSCNYQGGKERKHIVVTCENYVPVHFIKFA